MRKYYPLFIYPPLLVFIDQISKWWVDQKIPMGQSITVLPNYFELVHFRNRGAAFSMLAEWHGPVQQWFFYLMTLAAISALIWFYIKTTASENHMRVPLAMILGGALGNLIDRIFRSEVIDFLYFHWHNRIADFKLLGSHYRFLLAWPAFNVADMAITCGALYLVLRVIMGGKK